MTKKALTLVLALALAASLAACSGQPAADSAGEGNQSSSTSATEGSVEGNEPKTSTEEVADEPAELVIMTGADGNNHPPENIIKEELEKRTNIKFTPIYTAGGEEETRINLMISSGDIADIIYTGRASAIGEYAANGFIAPLNDLLDQYGQETLANKGELMRQNLCTINGEVYAIPRGFLMPNTLALRKDWLDTLSLSVPTTLDEFYDVLVAFKNNDPDGNGQNDTLPLGAMVSSVPTLDFVFGAYGVPANQFFVRDGEVTHAFLAPGFLDAMKYCNKLYQEGLLEPDYVTIEAMAEFEKLWNGKMGAFFFSPAGTTQNWLTRYVEDPAPEFVYTVLAGPNGEKGSPVQSPRTLGPWYAITTASKNAEAAMRFLDYICSEEGNTLTWLGIEGTHYEMADGKPQMIPPYDDAVEFRQQGGTAYPYINMRLDGWEFKMFNDTTREGINIGTDNPIDYIALIEQPAIASEVDSMLNDLLKEALSELVTTKGDIDATYERYRQQWLSAGGEEYLAQTKELYEKEYKQ